MYARSLSKAALVAFNSPVRLRFSERPSESSIPSCTRRDPLFVFVPIGGALMGRRLECQLECEAEHLDEACPEHKGRLLKLTYAAATLEATQASPLGCC